MVTPSPRAKLPPAAIGLLLATFAAFLPALFGEFVYDDFRFIQDNPAFQGPWNPSRAFTDPGEMDALPSHDIYRPLRTLLFHGIYLLGGGRPFLFHLLSLLLHVVNTWLVFLWVRGLWEDGPPSRAGERAALLGAGLFALPPIQVESVAWATSLGDVLAAFFVLLALRNAWIAGARRFSLGRLLLTAGLAFAACLSKESGAVTGGLILLYAALFKSRRGGRTILHAAAACSAAALYLALRASVLGGLQGQVPPYGGSPASNLIAGLYGLARQVGLIFRIGPASVEYPGSSVQALSPWVWTLAAAFAVGAGLCAAVLIRLKAKYAALGFFVFLLCLLPTSSLLFPMKSLFNDRYLYLPAAGLGLAAAAAYRAFAVRRPAAGRLRGAAALAVAAVLAGVSFDRTLDWGSEGRLWSATLEVQPRSIKARIGLSRVAFNEGRTEEALGRAMEAVERAAPGSELRTDAFYLAASALNRQGHEDEAAAYLRRALAEAEAGGAGASFSPRLAMICKNLWAFDMKAGRYELALEDVKALRRWKGEESLCESLEAEALKGMSASGKIKAEAEAPK